MLSLIILCQCFNIKTYYKKLKVFNSILKVNSKISIINMHIGGHHHNHDHDHDHDDDHEIISIKYKTQEQKTLIGKLLKPKSIALVLVSAFFIIIPAIVRRKLSRLDFALFCLTVCIFNAFDTMKMETKRLINKLKRFQGSLVKHSSPITLKYFFKNENAADRITLLGVWINILLSGSKLIGGMLFNSAVLVADAGHSMSDLFSDFITLWAVQVARIPADEDHPYGHGKFESIGSLFLSLTLLATGLSVGTWSYDKMKNVLAPFRRMALPHHGLH